MFNVFKKELMWGGRSLTLETGKMARQAHGSVLVTYGETIVLCTVVAEKEAKPDIDFFPLTINYQEKMFAAGRIPGGFFRREGKPSERETLICRLIDRPIRPLFPSNYKNETQVVCTVLSYDGENEPDIVALIGASAALTISGLPFLGPLAAAKIAYKDGAFILNPTHKQLADTDLELIVAGTSEGVLMVESEANELSEEIMLNAVMFGFNAFQPVIDAIIQMAETCAKDPWDLPAEPDYMEKLKARVKELCEPTLREVYVETKKQIRVTRLKTLKSEVAKILVEEEGYNSTKVSSEIKKLEQDIVRSRVLDGKRIDGRETNQVRQILAEVDVLPRAHGSSLFTRGETQVLSVLTLGTAQDEQIMDALEGEYKENFMLHYNFPPYSVGEVGRMSGPGRREIGHGKLAWRALHPMLPTKEAFPYTLRIVSEVTESNGSSSMATVCSASLAMMTAGVPLRRPIAGIAMGLIKEADRFMVISDILGDEDSLGDMDFKVAGSERGITALQMDIKITSITEEIMKIALSQAQEGRMHILSKMAEALETPRVHLNQNAPKITTMRIPKDKIREVIGSGGSVIRDIIEKTGAKIDIDDNGTVRIAAVTARSADAAIERIKSIATDPEVGEVYKGVIAKVAEFGVMITFLGGRTGLVHVSELTQESRRGQLEDTYKIGAEVTVRVVGFDRGRIRLSMKGFEGASEMVADQAAGG
ncbi:MAG: polyribonucleotide nucleotidyltransferase [Alphaproteobacteria bacterium]|nr:polyribonucleotide nucleotidyltransferase [Alphaproteobacteria bacterium]